MYQKGKSVDKYFTYIKNKMIKIKMANFVCKHLLKVLETISVLQKKTYKLVKYPQKNCKKNMG